MKIPLLVLESVPRGEAFFFSTYVDALGRRRVSAVHLTGIGEPSMPPENESQDPAGVPMAPTPPSREYVIPDKMRERLESDFRYHPPRPDQLPRYERLRAAARELAYMICAYTPPGREQGVALTSLEHAIMAANAGIAREPT